MSQISQVSRIVFVIVFVAVIVLVFVTIFLGWSVLLYEQMSELSQVSWVTLFHISFYGCQVVCSSLCSNMNVCEFTSLYDRSVLSVLVVQLGGYIGRLVGRWVGLW